MNFSISRTAVVRALFLLGGIAITTGAPTLPITLHAPFASQDPYALFGFIGTVFILAFVWYFPRKGFAPHHAMFWLLFTCVMLFNVGLVSEFLVRTYDFKYYEDAAKKYLGGMNPHDRCFVYPLPILQCFAWVYQAVAVPGTFLILVIPIFDIFPFSYHRLAGVVLLSIASSPGETPRSIDFSGIARRALKLFTLNSRAGQP